MTKKYLRMTWNERAQHVNLVINFTILVITGFALKYPEAFWAEPITDVPLGMTFRGFLHRLSGVAIVFLGGYHVLYLIFTERGRGVFKGMIPDLKDAVDLWETLKNNLFINRPAKDLKMGRFNFREKIEYFGFLWGTLVMTVTGFVLWFNESWLANFPMWTYDAAKAIHFYGAILGILTIIVWHFYSVIFDPDVYPMNWAWVTGEMTEHEMEVRHGLELEKLKAEETETSSKTDGTAGTPGGQAHPVQEEEKRTSIRRIYGTVRDLNKNIKDWKGE